MSTSVQEASVQADSKGDSWDWSSLPLQVADVSIQNTCSEVQKAVEEKINGGKPFGQFHASVYIQSGTETISYRIKVRVNTVTEIRLQVYQLPFRVRVAKMAPELTAVSGDGPLDAPF
ncbi:uncharacterized protein LOC135823713 [Sycon ciliatum]|uniref:uncharacterized protein LOC135823713 n=1 Tax=Sycon ciliatum TaxID=27933 RepID=UPI0031F64BEE